MKIKVTCALYIKDVGSLPFGTVTELDDKLATYLIENKRAVAVIEDTETEKPKATRKKTKKVVD